MGDGIVVPTDKLTSTSEVLQALSTSAGQVRDGLKAADPPEALWGVLGGLFMYPTYAMKAAEVSAHMEKIVEALDSQAGAIKASADNYRQLDEALQQAFQRFQDRLAGN